MNKRIKKKIADAHGRICRFRRLRLKLKYYNRYRRQGITPSNAWDKADDAYFSRWEDPNNFDDSGVPLNLLILRKPKLVDKNMLKLIKELSDEEIRELNVE